MRIMIGLAQACLLALFLTTTAAANDKLGVHSEPRPLSQGSAFRASRGDAAQPIHFAAFRQVTGDPFGSTQPQPTASASGTVPAAAVPAAPAAAVPAAPAAAVPAAPAAAVPVAAAPAPAPIPLNTGIGTLRANATTDEINQQLQLAKKWSLSLQKIGKTQSLVVPYEFFTDRLSLTKPLWRTNNIPLIDAAALFDATQMAASLIPKNANGAAARKIWEAQKSSFFDALEDNQQTDKIIARWRTFLLEWESAVTDDNRFAEALVQMGTIIGGIMSDQDQAHIQAVLTAGNNPVGGGNGASAVTSGRSSSGDNHRKSFLFRHHARWMYRHSN